MRGTPWIRFSLMAAVLALFAIPIWLLTRPGEPPTLAPAPTPQSAPRQREVTLEIETAPEAQAIAASYRGRELIPPEHIRGSFSGAIQLPADTTIDLVVTARWSGKTTAALRVRAFDESGLLLEQSFWGAQEVQDVFTIPEGE